MTTQQGKIPIEEFDFSPDTGLNFPSVEEYLSLHDPPPDDGSATTKAAVSPTTKKNNDDIDLARLLEPVVLSTTITTQYVKDLHELLQSASYSAYRLNMVFEFQRATTKNGVLGFGVVLKLESRTTGDFEKELSPKGCFPSKKHAKEAAAGLGIEYVKGLPERIASQAQSEASSTHLDEPKETENWVGLLQDYCQPRKAMPIYTIYQPALSHPEFSCDVTGIPSFEAEVFGDKTKYYRSKKIAKVQAAKAAVHWLNEQPMTAISPKPSVCSVGKFVGGASLAMPGSTIRISSKAGAIEKVTMICPRLGLSLPEYQITQDDRAPAIYDVTAVVRRGGEKKAVKIGPLKGIYGKKNAKEQMAGSILKWLNKEAERNQVTIDFKDS